MKKTEKTTKIKENKEEKESSGRKNPAISTRGRKFRGHVKKIIGRRAVIEFERLIYYKKYDRYAKGKTRLHAIIPEEFRDKINAGDFVLVRECKPRSKITNFVIIQKIK